MAKKKSAVEKWFDRLDAKTKKAIERQVRRAARSTGQAIGRGVSWGARAAVEHARVKPQTIIADMRAAGWSPRQIHERTGVPVRTQNDILKGRSNGQKHLKTLKEARKAGGRSKPPVEVVPVKSARQPGAGLVRHTKAGTTITVTPGTDPAWVAKAQREAAKRGTVKVVIKTPPPPPVAQPKISKAEQDRSLWEITDKNGRVRKVTGAQLDLAPGTLDKITAAMLKGDTATADRLLIEGTREPWYRNWVTPGSTLARTGTMDGSGGGPSGAAARLRGEAGGGTVTSSGGGGAGGVLAYDGGDDDIIYEDVAYEGEDDDADYGGAFTDSK